MAVARRVMETCALERCGAQDRTRGCRAPVRWRIHESSPSQLAPRVPLSCGQHRPHSRAHRFANVLAARHAHRTRTRYRIPACHRTRTRYRIPACHRTRTRYRIPACHRTRTRYRVHPSSHAHRTRTRLRIPPSRHRHLRATNATSPNRSTHPPRRRSPDSRPTSHRLAPSDVPARRRTATRSHPVALRGSPRHMRRVR
jgi:hypothetical protein